VRTHRDRIRLFGQMSDSATARGLAHAVSAGMKRRVDSEHLIEVLEGYGQPAPGGKGEA
jgi:hypothetical protein